MKNGAPYKQHIGRKLIQLRGRLSREEVAYALKISVSALQMYENGRRVPRDDIKVKLADFYGVTVQSLFYDSSQQQ
ncbi:helix-turn-helix transcriptional regulator [Xylanibacillus composti]|uniref:HTH cro/C1-type domain-containing protein n=1 Tax=Xylanibacillus composti TaxID=1572762 RepID=A0A8J4H5M7_9BACL|nr:helix-turn-helix transcriptional regulator [Xylanibacillus composti]GIQ69294.1 hypothetical protein XYCOK13_21180 [Xylanibacillus composti]